MSEKLRNSVVVITGSSSGIGRAAAVAFAREGANVVLAARRESALREVAVECESAGGHALVVPTDVTDERAVRELARIAIEHFGKIDVWVNNAAVEEPLETFRRVLETNLLGTVHGARAVLPQFLAQRRGVLINNASGWGVLATPYVSSYVASKFGIVGLSQSLRQELREFRDIHVCTLLPSAVDTPLFHHAGNVTGRAVRPIPPVYDPEAVARAMVNLAVRPRRTRIVGNAMRLGNLLQKFAPRLAEELMAIHMERTGFLPRLVPPTTGNLFEPMFAWTGRSGGWKTTKGPLGTLLSLAGAAAAYARAWPGRLFGGSRQAPRK
jgi:NAD(P)-dependent dehydrogenase (short-subunit alcohol dehydrogenase family)